MQACIREQHQRWEFRPVVDYTNSEEFNGAQLAETNRALDVLCVGMLPRSMVAHGTN